MREFGSKSEAELLRDAKTMDLADVIIYVYDSSDTNSFPYVSNLRVSGFLINFGIVCFSNKISSNSTAWIIFLACLLLQNRTST